MTQNVRKIQARTKQAGIALVALLAAATLAGHFLTRQSAALPTYPPGGLTSSDSLVTLGGRLDRTSVLQGGDGLVKMELTLQAADLDVEAARTPVDMIVVLDRSPSMAADGKIESAKAAIHELVSQLGDEDRLALVAFAAQAEVLIPLTRATPEVRYHWHQLVDAVALRSATNISAGLDLGLELAAAARRQSGAAGRLLLIYDGEANQGDTTVEGLTRRAAGASRYEFVLSSIGVGSHFNEFVMSAMADAGTGNYYYLSNTAQLAEVFGNELGATRTTVARAVQVTLEPSPGVEVIEAAGYPLETSGGAVSFRPGTLFAGQERRVWVSLRVPSSELGERSVAAVRASYVHDGGSRVVALPEAPRVACVGDRDAFFAGFDKSVWERSVIEEDYGQLREKVAGHVRSGRRDEALREIRHYEEMNRAMNQQLGSEEVRSNLRQVEALESEVDDAFVGRGQEMKRKVLSKKQQALSWDARRSGAKLKKVDPSDGSN